MSQCIVYPGHVQGSVSAITSKSCFQRAVAMSVLSQHPVTLFAKHSSDDSEASLSVAHDLGAHIEKFKDRIVIHPRAYQRKSHISCGESGLALRLFSSVASVGNSITTLQAEGSLLKRPMSMIETPLLKLGVKVESKDGFPPLTLKGELKAGEVEIDGSITSQFLTGLLIALPVLSGDSVIHVHSLKSIPYVSMTLELLSDFGVNITHDNFKSFYIQGNQRYSTSEIGIEGDWSGAAAFLIAGALTGEVTVLGLSNASFQADRAIVDILRNVGAEVLEGEEYVTVRKKQLQAFHYDATHTPDLFPVLAALATQCEGVSVIKGVHRLLYKESNRAQSILHEFSKAGVLVEIKEDEMFIIPSQIKKSAELSSCNDHRMVFAHALLGLVSQEGVMIKDPECVAKSYPDFFSDFESLRTG